MEISCLQVQPLAHWGLQKDKMYQGREEWWCSHWYGYHWPLCLPWPWHPPECLSCKVGASLQYSSIKGKRDAYWLLMQSPQPFCVIQIARRTSLGASAEPPFSVVQTSRLLRLECVTTLTHFCKGTENSVFGAMNVWGWQVMVIGGHDWVNDIST